MEAATLIRLRPDWSQGYQRLGQALLMLQEFEEAEAVIAAPGNMRTRERPRSKKMLQDPFGGTLLQRHLISLMCVQIFAKGCKINPNSKDMKFFLVQSRVQAMNLPIPLASAPLCLMHACLACSR